MLGHCSCTCKRAAPGRPDHWERPVVQVKERTPKARKTAAERQEQARKAGRAGHTVSAYVNRIVARAPELSPTDLDALRAIIFPTESADLYYEGMRVGARSLAERVIKDLERAANLPLPAGAVAA